jgi:hypothetical protein
MDSIRRENEKVPAMGNMPVNAKGDQIKRGKVTKTADEIARENHRVKSAIVSSGLKGKPPADLPSPVLEKRSTKEEKPALKRGKEVELPSGDIVIEDDQSTN